MIRITNQLESGSCTSKHPYNLDQLGDHGCGRKLNIMHEISWMVTKQKSRVIFSDSADLWESQLWSWGEITTEDWGEQYRLN